MNQPKFASGAHSQDNFAEQHLTPHFTAGTITLYPGAATYAICYGELCAFDADEELLASWSAEVPDCLEDVLDEPDYTGEWLSA